MHHGAGYRLQDVMCHQNVKGTITGSDHALELDEQFDVIIDANDQILERVVSEWNRSCVTVSVYDSELILKRVVWLLFFWHFVYCNIYQNEQRQLL